MPIILFADGFTTGAVLSLLLPVGVLIAILICFHLALKRLPGGTGGSASQGPSAAGAVPDGGAASADPPTRRGASTE